MANDVYTNPSTVATNDTSSASEWNTYVRDNVFALQLGLNGDGSTDTDAIHAHKQAAAGTAPPTAAKAGRIYLPNGQIYGEDGTSWYGYGPGPYDDCLRANSSTITPSASGHTWTEESGDWSITSNKLICATSGIASLNTRALLTRNFTVTAIFNLGVGTNEVRLIWKYVDASNYLYAALTDSDTLRVYRRIAGTTTEVGSSVTTEDVADSGFWGMEVQSIGQNIIAKAFKSHGTGYVSTNVQGHADFTHANFAAATKVGIGIPNAFDALTTIDVRF